MQSISHSRSRESLNDGRGLRAMNSRNFSPMPMAFEGMLKTSTETGDIGNFSIVSSPSRLPRRPGAAQLPMSPERRIRPNNIRPSPDRRFDRPPPPRRIERYQNVPLPPHDDRKFLPSYNMTPGRSASDSISVFDGGSRPASRQSTPSLVGRPFRDGEYRTSSMTTSTYRPPRLSSNYHSYTSLRSQPELIRQRPRSPYIYPTRLKRPGFRPCSPLLLDGGVDYSRRAEIERLPPPPVAPYMTDGRLVSPSSFHGHRRAPPPLSMRGDFNRPNLAPRAFASSPNLHQNWRSPAEGYVEPQRDWPPPRPRELVNPMDISPARSVCTYASTVNNYRSYPPGSTIASPARLQPPPSPLFYDYTEDFDTDEYGDTREDALPPFHLEKTIHEDRPLSMGCISVETSEVREGQPRLTTAQSVKSYAGEVVDEFDPQARNLQAPYDQVQNPTEIENLRPHSISVQDTGDSIVNLVQMYEHDNDTVLEQNGGFEAPKFPTKRKSEQPVAAESAVLPNHFHDLDNLTDRSSQYSLSSNLPIHFSKPTSPLPPIPTPLPPLPLLIDKVCGTGPGGALHLNKKLPPKPVEESSTFDLTDIPDMPSRPITSTGHKENADATKSKHRRSLSTQSGYFRSSKLLSVEPGLTDLAELVSSFEAAKARGDFGWSVGPNQPIRKPTPGNDVHCRNNGQVQATQRSLKQYQSDSNLASQSHRFNRHGYQELQKVTYGALQPTTNFSTPPMYAPKPISPARVAKLKGTVPQLMKALPALPTEENIRSRPPVRPSAGAYIEPSILNRPPPLSKAAPNSGPVQRKAIKSPPALVSQASMPTLPPPPPKLKLRLKRTDTSRRPTTSESSKPMISDGNNSWRSGQGSKSETPSQAKIPKFRLKVSRPSASSSETVRIHRETSRPRESLGIDNPTDLFTAPSKQHGIHALLSKVSRHFSNTKKDSTLGKSTSMENLTGGDRRLHAASSDRGSSLDLGVPRLPVPAYTGEVRSFFSDDSSQKNDAVHSLRKKFTNFRARIPSPYVSNGSSSKMVTQSCDDIVFRDRDRTMAVGGMNTLIENDNVTSDRINGIGNGENHPLQRQHRLRSKVSSWLGRAKHFMMTGYMKGTRSQLSTQRSGKEQSNSSDDG